MATIWDTLIRGGYHNYAGVRRGLQDGHSQIQCPLDIATLDIAAALDIATSTPMELGALALHK